MRTSTSEKLKRVVNNKLKGAFGMTHFRGNKATKIEINKKAHKNKNSRMMKGFAKVDRSLLNTIVHEETHARHPRMHEKTVRKVARKLVARMSKKQKKRTYARYK